MGFLLTILFMQRVVQKIDVNIDNVAKLALPILFFTRGTLLVFFLALILFSFFFVWHALYHNYHSHLCGGFILHVIG